MREGGGDNVLDLAKQCVAWIVTDYAMVRTFVRTESVPYCPPIEELTSSPEPGIERYDHLGNQLIS